MGRPAINLDLTYESYIAARVEKIPESGCWIWSRRIDVSGYGEILLKNKYWKAHRVSYHYYVGPIPEGMEIDHLCRVRCCVNPYHLEAVTGKENRRRGRGNGGILSTPVTHCRYGHALTPDNIYYHKRARSIGGNPWRQCRVCKRAQQRSLYWKAKEAANEKD